MWGNSGEQRILSASRGRKRALIVGLSPKFLKLHEKLAEALKYCWHIITMTMWAPVGRIDTVWYRYRFINLRPFSEKPVQKYFERRRTFKPERRNFAGNPYTRAYLKEMQCLPFLKSKVIFTGMRRIIFWNLGRTVLGACRRRQWYRPAETASSITGLMNYTIYPGHDGSATMKQGAEI